MNAAVAEAGAGSSRLRPCAGPGHADSGLRLLIGGALRRQLRWSPDPDAPAARSLCDGEVRLAIRWVELSADDLARSTGSVDGALHRGRVDWLPVEAIGCAEVVESRRVGSPPGQWLLGPLHVGTYQVLRLLSTDVEGCIAAEAIDARPARDQRYAWITGPQSRVDVSGPDAVEQAVRALRDRSGDGENRVRLSLCAAADAPRWPVARQ